MKKQHYGRILLTTSITGPRTGIPGQSHYAATKAGMNGLIHSAALELARYNITINGVEPGNILTEGLKRLGEKHIDQMAASIPLGRLGRPEDVAYAMLFLASDEAAWITGTTIVVDGGQILPEAKS
jgi:3-oxoacyl-[acyl-carrier protein] reductase